MNDFSLNTAQLRSILNPAKLKIDFWPRGTGKSTSLAFRLEKLAYECPRGKHLLVGRTFAQLQQRTLPPVFAELERMGYKKDVHFFFGKRPDKRLKIPEPFEPLLNYENTITWHTGACFLLISQDREGLARGINADSATADEAITLKREHIDQEILPSIRANLGVFKSKLHHSIQFASSKPIGTGGKWLLAYGNYYDEAGLQYSAMQRTLVQLQLEFLDAKERKEQEKIWLEICSLTIKLKYYAIKTDDGSLFYNEAHIFENIKNLGINYIRRLRRTMTELSFLIEVLNLTISKIDSGFYASFNQDKHCDEWFDYSYLDQFNFDFQTVRNSQDCRYDDYLKNEPLDIAADYNAAINSMVIGQWGYNREYRVLNSLFVKSPFLSSHNAKQFCDYYQAHHRKEVNFFYDHTAIGMDASRDFTHVDEIVRVLEENGWIVNKEYVGQAKSHHWRYNFFNRVFQEEDPMLPRIRFFKTRTEPLIRSMELAGVKQGTNGFEKDKAPERNKKIPAEEATHLSEAFDTLIHGALRSFAKRGSVYVGIK
jgi:hypothetical protein